MHSYVFNFDFLQLSGVLLSLVGASGSSASVMGTNFSTTMNTVLYGVLGEIANAQVAMVVLDSLRTCPTQ